jgi:hypothetical protein
MELWVEIEPDDNVRAWATAQNERLKGSNFIRNPFNGSVHVAPVQTLYTNIRPIYMHPYPFAIMAAMLFLIFPNIWTSIPLIATLIMMVPHTKYWFYFVMWLSLRRAGYKGKYRLLK